MNDDESVLVARAGEYYATLDGFGRTHVHDVLLHPLRPLPANNEGGGLKGSARENALPASLPPSVRAALEDLFLRDRGPGLRATFAHGSVDLAPRPEVRGGACARLLLCIALEMCALHPPLETETFDDEALSRWREDVERLRGVDGAGGALRGYEPAFHPIARARASLDAAVAEMSARDGSGSAARFAFEIVPASADEDTVTVTVAAPSGGVRVAFTEKTNKTGSAAAADEPVVASALRDVLAADADAAPTAAREIARAFLLGETVAAAAAAAAPSSSAAAAAPPKYSHPPPPPPGPSPGAECLRAAADEIAAAAVTFDAHVDRLARAVETREARSNHRRQLCALSRARRTVRGGLTAALVAVEAFIAHDADDDDDDWARRRLLSYVASVRSACARGQGVDAARVAAGFWRTRAGRTVIQRAKRANSSRCLATSERVNEEIVMLSLT